MDLSHKIFVEELTIPTYFVDSEQKMTTPSIFLLLQEVAWKHASQYGFGFRDLQAKEVFWVLSKIKLIVHDYPKWGDFLRIETWGKEPELLTAFRDFQGFDKVGHKFFDATSSWHILNTTNNRPQRMDDFREQFPIPEGKHAIEQKPEKLPTHENLHETNLCKVLPSDIDMNLHVNNTKYIQWVLDSFSFDFLEQHILTEIEVNFLSQAKVGGNYFIAYSKISENEYLSSVINDNKKELAKIRTTWKDKQ